MTESATKQIVLLLDQLGSKLGATGLHLYEVLVRQGEIEALKSVVSASIALLIVIVSLLVSLRTFRKGQSTNWSNNTNYEVLVFLSGLLTLLSSIALVITICDGDWYLYFNPEMYPLQYLRSLAN